MDLESCFMDVNKVSKGTKIRNRYNRVPHLTKNTNGKVTNSQLDTTNDAFTDSSTSSINSWSLEKNDENFTPCKKAELDGSRLPYRFTY